MVALNLDPRQHVPEFAGGNFTLWPKGWIKVAIASSDWKPTKANDQSVYLQLEIKALENPQGATADIVGTSNYIRLNLGNKGANAQKVVDRAASEAAAIGYVCGIVPVADTNQLHNIPFYVDCDIEVTPATSSSKEMHNNRFKAYKRVDGADPVDIARQMGGAVPTSNGAGAAPQPSQAPGFVAGAAPAGATTAPPFGGTPAGAPAGAPPFNNGGTPPATSPPATNVPGWQQGAAPAGAAPAGQAGGPWGNR